MRLWREWCRQEGIGEIDLLFVEFQGARAPEAYGCDAMIEFPPAHGTYFGPGSLRILGYQGALIDAPAAVEHRDQEPLPAYPFYRTVCPGWDDTPSAGPVGTLMLRLTPQVYGAWLQSAAMRTVAEHAEHEQRLLFVNGWNAWTEGAHLEPDLRHGYAYLEATRQGLRAVARQAEAELPGDPAIAVAIHAFYPDVLEEMPGAARPGRLPV